MFFQRESHYYDPPPEGHNIIQGGASLHSRRIEDSAGQFNVSLNIYGSHFKASLDEALALNEGGTSSEVKESTALLFVTGHD